MGTELLLAGVVLWLALSVVGVGMVAYGRRDRTPDEGSAWRYAVDPDDD